MVELNKNEAGRDGIMTEIAGEVYSGIEYNGNVIENSQFVDCVFENCSFYETEINNCAFKGCTFINCSIVNCRYKYTMAINNKFKKSVLLGVNWSDLMISNAVFMPFNKMEDCTLKYCVFYGLKLKKFDFENSNIVEGIFEECQLQESKFKGCNLKGTTFNNNNLTGADFREAKGYGIELENNRLRKAKFSFPDVITLLDSLGIEVE